MKNFIGGLFKDQKGAELARNALKENGFETQSINLLERSHENKAVMVKNPPIQSIAIAAVIGGVILGTIGALIGFMGGLGVIRIPVIEPSGGATVPFQVTPELLISSLISGAMLGGVTGIIMGVATRFWMDKYRKVNLNEGRDGNYMLAVQTDDMRRETKAKLTMKEYGAIKFEEFRDKWDTEIWSVFEEKKISPQAG